MVLFSIDALLVCMSISHKTIWGRLPTIYFKLIEQSQDLCSDEGTNNQVSSTCVNIELQLDHINASNRTRD